MRQQQTKPSLSKKDSFSYQPSTDYFFKSSYEYEGPRKAEAISRSVLNDFILPCWVQRYLTTEEFTTGIFGGIKKEVVLNYLNMLDCRTFSLKNQDGQEKIELSFLDRNELEQLRLIREMNQEFVEELEVQNFRKQAIRLYTKWENFQRLIQVNDKYRKIILHILRKTKTLKIYICQRLFRGDAKLKKQKSKDNHQHVDEVQPDQFVDDEFFYFRDTNEFFKQNNSTVFQVDQKIFSCSENNWFIPCFQKVQNVEEPYKLTLKITFQKQLQINYDRKILYYRITQNQEVKRLQIVFQIEDKAKFFTQRLKVAYQKDTNKELECFNQSSNYSQIPAIENRNKVIFPYQQSKFQRNKINLYKHFHLAFQGGGAKGLAYVGAYKSIREQKTLNPFKKLLHGIQEQERIPIKSIMGSSAGGIIALGISTGIPQYQLQKICYKMNSIPSTDRFYNQGDEVPEHLKVKAYDDYGNQITMQIVKENFARILDQYGILQKDIVQKLFKFISQSEQSKVIQDKLLNWLSINSNAMAQILTLEQKDVIEPGFFSGIFGSRPQQITRKRINWEGLVLHGALMKGQAIHDIAKDCLVKFLYKQVMYLDEKQFLDYLKACQDTEQREPILKYKAENINHFLKKQITYSRDLLFLKLKDIYEGFAGNKDAFGVYLVGILNRFIILIDNYFKLLNTEKGGLILIEKEKSLIDISELPFKEGHKQRGLIQYFKTCYLQQNDIPVEDVRISEAQQQQYLHKKQAEGILNTKEGHIRHKNCRKVSKIFRTITREQSQKLSYSEINSLLKKQNLIDPSHLDFNEFKDFDSNKTLFDFLVNIFGKQLQQIQIIKILQDTNKRRFEKINQQKSDEQLNSFFYSLEAAESIYEVYGLLKNTVKDLKEGATTFNQAIKHYEGNMRQFKEEVSKVNMREYYRMTGIELGCTSVDLDNKVLRFFNQKTTPLLPVCRSVQMTGSFPVGFKAQKWRKEWGLYHVYSLEKKQVIDITGHQFTDGGLLANFPIKYMDNDLIRRRYFSHKAINRATILLGFGLDYLDGSRYQLTQNQMRNLKQQKNRSAIAMQQLKNIFGLWTAVSNGLSVFFNTKEGKETSAWSQIEHWMIKQIPLLRFGLKIVEAYPNADRNINLQSFDNKVLVQEMWPDWKLSNNDEIDKKQQDKAFIKQINDIFHLHLKLKYDQFNQGRNLQNLRENNVQQKVQLYGKQVNFFIRQRQIDINDRNRIIQDQFKALFNPSNIQRYRSLVSENEPGKHLYEKASSSSNLSLSIVNIFFIHLRIKDNREVVDRYNRYYTFMKFVASDYDYQKRLNNKNPIITTSQDIPLEEELNRINFSHLYKQRNFDQIAKNLGLEGYYNEYYSEFVKKYEADLTRQNQEKFKKDKKKETEDKIKKQYPKDHFYEVQLFDVSVSLKKMTQLIYLLVKGRDENGKLKGVAEIRKLTVHVKSTNYIDLFYNENNNYRAQDPEPLYYCQIIDFFKKEFKQFQNNSLNLYITDSFYNFINEYNFQNHQNMKIRYLEDLIKHKNSQKVALNTISSLKDDNKGAQKWLDRQYKFVLKYKSKEALITRMHAMIKEQIFKNKNNGPTISARTLFQILYQRKADTSDSNDKEQVRQLDDLLVFIFDEQVNVGQVFGISIETEENIKRKKNAALGILLNLYKNYSETNPLPQQINFMKQITTKDSFVKNIIEKTPVLKLQPTDQNSQKLRNKIKKNIKPGPIDSFSLTLVEMQVIYWCVDSKLKSKVEEAQKVSGVNYSTEKLKILQDINNCFFQDMKYLLVTLKQMIFLTESILYEDKQFKSPNSVQIINIFKKKQIANKLIYIYEGILGKFIPRYYALEDVSLSELGNSKLSYPFIIEFDKINKLSQQVYRVVAEMYINNCKDTIQKSQKEFSYLSENYPNHQENIVRYVYILLAKMVRYKFSLPLLDIQWQLSIQSTGKFYQEKVFNILALQAQKKSNSFAQPVYRYKELKQAVVQTIENKDIDSDVHLILEGVQSSNSYFGGLYQNIGKIMADRIAQAKQAKIQKVNGVCQPIIAKSNDEQIGNIKAITCANFHSVFGFLLCMGFSLQEIRKQMYKLKYITNSIENQAKIETYFDTYSWANNSSHRHRVLLEELQKHNTSFFDRIDTLRRRDYQYTLLPKQFEEIKLIYEHEKEMILQTEAKILDQTAQTIQNISDSPLIDKYPLQISKKFGYDYLCNLSHRHQYRNLSQKSFESFKSIATMIYNTFGSLIQGIICNSIATNNSISVGVNNASFVTKALLINKLLSTFKLNSYITEKLKDSRLSPNISLSEFYQVSKRKIFLNFTVIDVNRQRLAFLNKNTMPNMPLWAAIIATSSLPFFHQFFQANKEWQATDASSFYDFFIYQFFKADQDKNTRITKYTSGNFISSVPLQLLTNNTLRKKIFDPVKDRHLMNIPQFAVCFNPSSQNNKIVDTIVKKKYINIGVGTVLKGALSGMWSGIKSIPGSILNMVVPRKNANENETYNISYSPTQYLSNWLGSTTFMTTLSILSNSNDNFILKLYYDKLIRLPIKIDTLDFHEIVEGSILSRFKVNVLSEKAQQTVERSYEITNSFIYNIVKRTYSANQWKEKAIDHEKQKSNDFSQQQSGSTIATQRALLDRSKQPQKQTQNIVKKILEFYKKSQKDRFKVRFRIEVFSNAHPLTGFERLQFKLNLLNHSKWNHNNYNNFVVQYSIDEGEDLYGNKKIFKRAKQSEIIWLVESNTIITLKFLYLLKEKLEIDEKALQILYSKDHSDMQIRETQIALDFKDIIRKLPLRDSYDYEFHYGWEENFEPEWQSEIIPIKRNKLSFTQIGCEQDAPKVKLTIIGEESSDQFKTKHIIKKTTRHVKKQKKGQKQENLRQREEANLRALKKATVQLFKM